MRNVNGGRVLRFVLFSTSEWGRAHVIRGVLIRCLMHICSNARVLASQLKLAKILRVQARQPERSFAQMQILVGGAKDNIQRCSAARKLQKLPFAMHV